MKRPASSKAKAKAESITDKLEKWRGGLKKRNAENPEEEGPLPDAEEGQEQGEEEHPKEEDQCVEPEENATRNKYAASKFKELLKSNALPKHVLDVWQKGSRKVKTDLVNSLFKKNAATGKWEMNTADPTFCRILKTQETKFGTESVESVPRSIMLYGTFRGDEEALAQAIACGDVVETECNGKAMLGFQKTSAGKKKENTDETQATSGTAPLSRAAFSAMAGLQAKYNWTTMCMPGLEDQAHGGIKKSTTLALCDQPGRLKWEDCEGMFQEAAAAQDRLLKDAGRIQPPVGASKDSTLIGQFKECFSTFKANHSKLQDVLLWKEPYCAYYCSWVISIGEVLPLEELFATGICICMCIS